MIITSSAFPLNFECLLFVNHYLRPVSICYLLSKVRWGWSGAVRNHICNVIEIIPTSPGKATRGNGHHIDGWFGIICNRMCYMYEKPKCRWIWLGFLAKWHRWKYVRSPWAGVPFRYQSMHFYKQVCSRELFSDPASWLWKMLSVSAALSVAVIIQVYQLLAALSPWVMTTPRSETRTR